MLRFLTPRDIDGRRIGRDPVRCQNATSVRWLVLLLIALASSVAYLTRHSIAVTTTTIQEDLQLTTEQMGWILSAYAIGYFFFQVPTGWLGTRFGTRVILSSLCVLWSLFTLWSAASYSYLSLLVSRIAFGSAQAGLVPNSAQAVNDWLPLDRRGFASATIGAAMSVGGTVTMGATAMLLNHFSWREVLVLYSLAGVVWAAAFVFVFRTKPEDHPWVNEAERILIRSTHGSGLGAEGSPPEQGRKEADPRSDPSAPGGMHRSGVDLAAHLGRSVSMWAICLQALFRAAGYGLFVTWFPAFLEKGYGVTRESAGLMTMSPLVGVLKRVTDSGGSC